MDKQLGDSMSGKTCVLHADADQEAPSMAKILNNQGGKEALAGLCRQLPSADMTDT